MLEFKKSCFSDHQKKMQGQVFILHAMPESVNNEDTTSLYFFIFNPLTEPIFLR